MVITENFCHLDENVSLRVCSAPVHIFQCCHQPLVS